MKVVYNGPHLVVEIDDAARDFFKEDINRGEEIDVPDEVGTELVKQSTWDAVSGSPTPAAPSAPSASAPSGTPAAATSKGKAS